MVRKSKLSIPPPPELILLKSMTLPSTMKRPESRISPITVKFLLTRRLLSIIPEVPRMTLLASKLVQLLVPLTVRLEALEYW